jgi:hypothetical protein
LTSPLSSERFGTGVKLLLGKRRRLGGSTSELEDSSSMMGSDESEAHEIRTMFAKGRKSQGFSEMIGFVLSGTDSTEESYAFTNKSLKGESFESDVADVASYFTSVCDDAGGRVVFSHGDGSIERKSNIFL